MRPIDNFEIRVPASKYSLMIVRMVLAIIMACSLVDALYGSTEWTPFFIALAAQGFVNLWLFRFALAIEGNVLQYRTLFRGWTRIRLHEIESVEMQIGERTYRDKFRPPIRLHVKAKASSAIESFDINLKVFRQADLERLINFIEMALLEA